MRGNPVPKPTPGDWSDALLTSGTEALLGAVRNYLGPIKTPYDKHDLVAGLAAFLNRAETKEALLSMLDPLDIRILGSSLLLGSVPEQSLKDLFVGEMPLFELGVRISNLFDRLLLFRYQAGGRRLVAVNPLLEDEVRARALDPDLFFGPTARSVPGVPGGPVPGVVDARAAVALFCFLFHAPLSIRKGGGLTKRAAERVASLFPELSAAGEGRVGAIARALSVSGILRVGEQEELRVDREAFATLLAEWGYDLPFFLAACLAVEASGQKDTRLPEHARRSVIGSLAVALAIAMESLPEGVALPRGGLARWLRIAARGVFQASHPAAVDPAVAFEALEVFGMLTAHKGRFVPAMPRRPEQGAESGLGSGTGTLVAEGSHALHLMPEASLEERLFVGCVARPVSAGMVWSFEVERDTVRRAFAAGLSASVIKSRFESLAGSALPQSFAFSLSAWEEEYRSLRLYHGFALVADERQRLVVERSVALAKMDAERLAPGVYFLSASTYDAVIAALAAAGLDAPPLIQATVPRHDRHGEGERPGFLPVAAVAAETAGQDARRRISASRDLLGPGLFARRVPGPDPELRLASLRGILASSKRTEEERRELADRIERRLVLTERQIAQSDPRPDRLEAGGLDYLGKVRVVEHALRAPGDRLEILYRLPGEEPVRAILRPVRLDKNEKGLVLEAEDLGTGGPARVPLGAVSTVRRVRASLFGEEQ